MAKRLRRDNTPISVGQSTISAPPSSSISTAIVAVTSSTTLPSTPISTSASPSPLTPSLTTTLSSTSASVFPNSSFPHGNTSSSNSSSNNIVAGGDQISVGEIVGSSIGAFFAGVLLTITAVLLFIMLRKKKTRARAAATKGRSSPGSGGNQETDPSSKEMGTIVRQGEVATDVKLERILLEPGSSHDIKTQMMMINNEILQHVDNNYHLKAIDVAPDGIANLLTSAGYESSTGLAVNQIGLLIQDVKYRRATIRHLIGWFILSNIALTADPKTSLLPGYITAVLRQMPPAEKVTGSKEALDLMFNKWRVITAYLLQNVRSNRDPLVLRDRDVQQAITNNMSLIQPFLQPFIKPGAERRQAENLQSLLLESAKLGLLLFQQPDPWAVDWNAPPASKQGGKGRQATIILFPGLTKTVADESNRYAEVKVVLTAEVLQL